MYSRLYVHVPFCREKCGYCAFASAPPRQDELAHYPALLLEELKSHPTPSSPLRSVYFGGGTPSLLLPQQIGYLRGEIGKNLGIAPDAEITLEANPGTVTASSLSAFKDAGINRLSLGIQSFNDHFLKKLGRIHTAAQAEQAFREARSAGFTAISIDLIHSLPGQQLEQWRNELHQALRRGPEHISIYGLTIEEHTPFAHLYPPGSPLLVEEDLSADMFELADQLLTEAGFEHYEIANYCRPGFASRHNCGYWTRDGYLGLGVAAHSFFRDGHGLRFSNADDLPSYRHALHAGHSPSTTRQYLTREEAMSEYLFLGLRLTSGISLAGFEEECGISLESAYRSSLTDLIRLGLLRQQGDRLVLTPRGMLLSNQVFSRFL